MVLDFAVLADDVIRRPDGKLDISGAGFDTIYARLVPVIHDRLVVAIRILLARHEAEHPHRIDTFLQAADGAELARARTDVPVVDDARRAAIPAGRLAGFGLILSFEEVVFPGYGAYQLVLQWDGTEARPPLQLRLAQSPAP